ncbi:MAG: hypothetical protein IGS03_16670 [Candidatus Sericytochromatia bacterium]|nr:hypothetical protein [Candidatus Sericytochromatia bacterium]
MDNTWYHLLNITTLTIGSGVVGLALGFNWGRESAAQPQQNAAVTRDAARINGFKTVFEAGVNQKKSAPVTGAKTNTRR